MSQVFEATPEQNREITQLRTIITLLMFTKGIKQEIGICALSEIILLAYSHSVFNNSIETVKESFNLFIKTLEQQGINMIEAVAKVKDKEKTTKIEEVDDIVKQFKRG